MNYKLVTIAIPFYKDVNYLSFAITSVINQTYTNWELFLVDDGSTDGSLNIARSFEQKDSRIKVFCDGENLGLAKRLNQTISMANGKYYARMDADDIMSITRIEKQVAFLDSHPNVDVLGSSVMLINADNIIVGSGDMSGVTKGFVHPSIMGQTAWFKRNKYATWCRRCQDQELWLRTSSTSNFVNLSFPLLFYREAGTISFQKYLSSQKASLKIFKHYETYGFSFYWFIKSSFAVYIRIVICCIFSILGKIDFMVKRRKRIEVPTNLLLTKEDLQLSIRK